jgi:uncharacterized membrane protein YkoI
MVTSMTQRSTARRRAGLALGFLAVAFCHSAASASEPGILRSDLILTQAASEDTIAITQAMARAQERFVGTIIEAELDVGRPHEKTDSVYQLRMLTERGDILRIRVDARDGTILEADGRGLVDARRRP